MTNKINNVSFTEFSFDGFKNIKPIRCNSEWLLNYLHFLEWDVQVKNYFQPDMSIPSEYARMPVDVKIDMWVNLCNGDTYLVHLKNNKFETNPGDHSFVLADCKQFCLESNLNFQAIDQAIPECEPRKSNINLLWNYAHRELHHGHLWLTNRFFTDEPFPTIGKFKKLLTSFDFDPDLVYTFLFHHALGVEISHFPLSDETFLTKGETSNVLVNQINLSNETQEASPTDSDPDVF